MMSLHFHRSVLRTTAHLLAPLVAICGVAHAQLLNQDIEIQVHELPALMARTPHSSDVLLTSLDTVLHDREICCGRDSALGDSAEAADPHSLKDVASKLDGRHLMGDGRPISVRARYVTADQINSGELIASILNQNALLIRWDSRLYVVHGVIYRWVASGGSSDSGGGSEGTVIHKLLLWDTRYSDSRREVVFDRTADDLTKVQGLLYLEWKPE